MHRAVTSAAVAAVRRVGVTSRTHLREHAFLLPRAAASRHDTFPPWTLLSAAAGVAAVGAVVASLGSSDVDCASVPHVHGFASSRYGSLPDMIEDVFPALCKIQGFVGERKLGGGSAFLVRACRCGALAGSAVSRDTAQSSHKRERCTCAQSDVPVGDVYVVTNAHVFQAMMHAGAREMQAQFDDGRTYVVDPLAMDEEADIAVGRIISAPPGARFSTMRIGSLHDVRRGDGLCVLGAPLGGSLVPTAGVLSGVRYVADDELMNSVLHSRADWCLLQVDANMSSGSSGGPIVSYDGEVVGVSVMVQTGGTAGVGNVNFGVSIDQAWPIVQSLISTGSVARAYIGMTIMLVDAVTAAREAAAFGVPLLPSGAFTGLLVTHTVQGRPAEESGIREGDVILSINGATMRRKGDYFAALGPTYDPSRELRCVVYRPPLKAGGKGATFEAVVKPTKREMEGGRYRGARTNRRREW